MFNVSDVMHRNSVYNNKVSFRKRNNRIIVARRKFLNKPNDDSYSTSSDEWSDCYDDDEYESTCSSEREHEIASEETEPTIQEELVQEAIESSEESELHTSTTSLSSDGERTQ